MSNRKKNPILIEKIEIIDTANKGKSIAKHDDRVIIVDNGVPGDICDVSVYKRRRKYWQAEIKKIHKYSQYRVTPKCEHFGVCGGCKWQNMQYNSQLKFKEKEVLNNLKRIGKIDTTNHEKIIGSKEDYFYRNKMEFTFSNKRWLSKEEIKSRIKITDRNACGFHVPGMFDKIINLNHCYLQKEPSNRIRLSINKFSKKNKFSYFDIREKKGFLRNLIIKNSSKGDLMVLMQFYENNKKNIKLLMNHLKDSFSEITSLLYTVNQKANSTIYDQKIILFHGKEYIQEELDGLLFNIGAKSFFQTNSNQAKILYRKTKELANIKKNEVVYDLYTGTGTIAQFVANSAKKVIGIDSVIEGIEAAFINAKQNNITNCSFYCGDMKEIFSEHFIKKNGHPDIIIADPPREGMHKKVIEQILKIKPNRIIYVSCNSATQARDINILSDIYKIKKIQPVDMFPQTHHVENIVSLEIKH
ncbi:MAG: 23S rRNA (uracil(1939)-C(5))-methyltransferase RlmD [Flavobacteriales bacterium]|nr:23S rRNA (uracil(1939)-C(5))-methyltransferase RlmD [Flavobacteriales bacterium]|tara:strand:- start:6963 stop:8375 length:1413 start_codon:yes stop_codon:yes gene_type:complete